MLGRFVRQIVQKELETQKQRDLDKTAQKVYQAYSYALPSSVHYQLWIHLSEGDKKLWRRVAEYLYK